MVLNLIHYDFLSEFTKAKHVLGKSAQLASGIPDDLVEGMLKCRASSIEI